MYRLTVLVGALALAAPVSGLSRSAGPAFVFGRTGGNIQPFRVEIASDGQLTVRGAVRVAHPNRTLSEQALARLRAIAAGEHFFSLARTIRCPGTLPDVAGNFVTVRTPAVTRTVLVHGGCSARFQKVYAALARAAGVLP